MIMPLSRRSVFASAACAGLVAPALAGCVEAAEVDRGYDGLEERILGYLSDLPGIQAIKIDAPPAGDRAGFHMSHDAGRHLFVGSAIKAFVLCERLRQIDGPDVVKTVVETMLELNDSVWSVDSATFNPPHLSGTVSERTTMEAMILHSDNTATDMELKQAGPAAVRRFLAEAGLDSSAVPDSTRSFFGYLLGAQDFRSFTWAELVAAANSPIVNSPLNPVETLASSADDLVSFYQRSTAGDFFQASSGSEISATTKLYRDILSIGDVIRIVFPLGASVFAKGGSIDVPGFHTLCIPGAMNFSGRWVYVAFILNWYAAEETDPATVDRYLAGVRASLLDIFETLGR